MKTKRIIAGLAAILLVVAMAYGMYRHDQYKKSPEYSLTQLEKAIEEHDIESFKKYADVQGLVNGLMDQLLEIGNREKKSNARQPTLVELISNDLLYFSKPQLVGTARFQLLDYVKTGEYGGKINSTARRNPEVLLSKIWCETIGCNTTFQGIEYVREEGELAQTGLNFLMEDHDVVLVLELEMEDRGEYWQVTRLGNFPDFMRELVELRNKRVLDEMNRTLILEGIDKSTTNGVWGIGKKVIFELQVRNQGQKEIGSYVVKVDCMLPNGKELESFTIDSGRKILAGEKGKGSWFKDINKFSTEDEVLYTADRSDLDIKATVQQIVFADESTLELWGERQVM